MSTSTSHESTAMPDANDFARLEHKVDKLTDAVSKLVLIEERQVVQGQRVGALEQRVAALETAVAVVDKKVDQWVNRGIGVWALAGVLWGLYMGLTR